MTSGPDNYWIQFHFQGVLGKFPSNLEDGSAGILANFWNTEAMKERIAPKWCLPVF